jgi:hypothetical protein
MSRYDQQLHGYQHGHQLLSGTIKLPKTDQDLVDRLSDVAGPLGPGERFSPYLTCYPLPSGTHYVVARTWQDLDAPRAGCVRTRSLLVSMADWMKFDDVATLVELVTRVGPDRIAERGVPIATVVAPLPPVDILQGTELLEALFLEDRVPIVVFDAERPDTIAVRLLTAFWPAFRRNFSVSTFCRSPRMIARRSFDLVFAPKDSRSRFGDWQGRRIDGRRREPARHPWSGKIVDHVFRSPKPSLRSLDVLGEMSRDDMGSEAALRVSLLWDELQRKLETAPNAALGLLDIANTRSTRNVQAIRALEPALAHAARSATTSMAPNDAWRFLGALTDKLGDLRLTLSAAKSIRSAAVDLAAAHPSETIEKLSTFVGNEQREMLVSAAGEGLARVLGAEIANRLQNLDGSDLLGLMLASPTLAESGLRRYPAFSTSIAEALKHADAHVRDEARRRLLRLLVEDEHVDPARILIADLDETQLIAEARHLYEANRLGSEHMREVVVERAREANAVEEVREAVVAFGEEVGVDEMVALMVHPNAADFAWTLATSQLSFERRLALVLRLVRLASAGDLRSMLGEGRKVTATLDLLERGVGGNTDALCKIAANVPMEPEALVDLTLRILPSLKGHAAAELAEHALDAALPHDLESVWSSAIEILLGKTDSELNGVRAMRLGLERGVSSAAASRNLIAFNRAPTVVRKNILMAVEEMAGNLIGRYQLDLSLEAVEAAASILWDSEAMNPGARLRASASLLPFLLDARDVPASPLIASAFPPVYWELRRESAPDFLSFVFIFLDWDKCKSARRRLIDAFLRSDWRPTDIALAAARAGDAERILRRVSRGSGGERAIKEIEQGLKLIPTPWRQQVRTAIREIDPKGSPLQAWDE